MRKITAIIGVPGTGKTTLMRKFMGCRSWTATKFADLVYGHIDSDNKLAIVGKYEEGEVFAGTDRLSMAAQPAVMEWLASYEGDVIFEGDRLTGQKFFDGLQALGCDVEIMVLHANPDVLKARYEERGSNQDEKFLQGRRTKIDNITSNFDYMSIISDWKNETPEQQAEILEHLNGRHPKSS
jgi:broad-specificity NMP kinase